MIYVTWERAKGHEDPKIGQNLSAYMWSWTKRGHFGGVIKHMGRLAHDRSYFNEACLHRILLASTLPLVIENVYFLVVLLHVGVLSPAFKKRSGGQGAVLVPAVFQAPWALNNSHAKGAYFGVPSSTTLQTPVMGGHTWLKNSVCK